jgi:hypothetical protein
MKLAILAGAAFQLIKNIPRAYRLPEKLLLSFDLLIYGLAADPRHQIERGTTLRS